ncbi:Uncharacterised protein [Porphyromonas cangingivalis]|uniref:Uncharacterized protein n=1 Tax=Porphyromonas cangingivalis TaxID=36874 RepID=A0A1T4M8H4_PORCN|nr:hypothetical protein SAMN02745205_01433 [Porphyromonas cangingivalis]VEJ02375.1 Uncharacterised protein [Porphyromonas cangingivalis]
MYPGRVNLFCLFFTYSEGGQKAFCQAPECILSTLKKGSVVPPSATPSEIR